MNGLDGPLRDELLLEPLLPLLLPLPLPLPFPPLDLEDDLEDDEEPFLFLRFRRKMLSLCSFVRLLSTAPCVTRRLGLPTLSRSGFLGREVYRLFSSSKSVCSTTYFKGVSSSSSSPSVSRLSNSA